MKKNHLTFIVITLLVCLAIIFGGCASRYPVNQTTVCVQSEPAFSVNDVKRGVTFVDPVLSSGDISVANDQKHEALRSSSDITSKTTEEGLSNVVLNFQDEVVTEEDAYALIAYSIAYELDQLGYDVYRGVAVVSEEKVVAGLLFTKYEHDGSGNQTCGFFELLEDGRPVLTDALIESGIVAVADSESLLEGFVINQYVLIGNSSGIIGEYYFKVTQIGNYSIAVELYEDSPVYYDYSVDCINYNNGCTAWASSMNMEFNAVSLYTADEKAAYEQAIAVVDEIIAIQNTNVYSAERFVLVLIETSLLETIVFDEQRALITTDDGKMYDINELNGIKLEKNQMLMVTASEGVKILTIPDEDAINEALALRRTTGLIQIISASLLTAGSIVLSVVSFGTATPVAVTCICVTAGLITTTYAVSNMIEGINNVKLANDGDLETLAANPIRDALASAIGDEHKASVIYHAIGTTVSIIQALLIPVGAGLSVAHTIHATTAQTVFLVARAVTFEAVKLAATIGTSYLVSMGLTKIVLEQTGSEVEAQWAGFAGGLLTGIFTYKGLTLLDKRFNISGIYPKVRLGKVVINEVRREQALKEFTQENWQKMSLSEKKTAIEKLADVISDELGLDNRPSIKYYNSANGKYGAYEESTNTLKINTYYFENGNTVPWTEIVDTVAHELRHAYQAANLKTNPNSEISRSFRDYIRPEQSSADYYNQACEVDARAYAKTWADYQLIAEVKQLGVKCNSNEIIGITRDTNGKIVWLEKGHLGDRASGYAHIVDAHGKDFINVGVNDIPEYLLTAISEGKIIGYQSVTNATPRPVYEFFYNGDWNYVAITIGDNGYIVGANPVTNFGGIQLCVR